MISLVIPTLDAGPVLARSLTALAPAALEGLVRDLVIADGGSSDMTMAIAEEAGAIVVSAPRGRGRQLMAGAKAAKGPWLLFLHADTILQEGWMDEVAAFIGDPANAERAAAFRFALDDASRRARLLEYLVYLRCALLRLPYGDQGLLISRDFYHRLGGFAPIALMEDVDMARRIGRRRLHMLKSRAVTSAERYRKYGYLRRSWRNLSCLAAYFRGVDPEILAARYYERRAE